MATIAIGQRLGSGGAELGALIARRLEARFLGLNDLLREAANRYKADPEQMRVFDTREPHFWEWLTTDTPRLLTYFHAVILKHLAEDKVVLVSHSMPVWVPRGVGHVVRVLTVAPIEVRMKRVMDAERMSARQAEHRVRESITGESLVPPWDRLVRDGGFACFQFYRTYSLNLSYNVARLFDVTSMRACPIFG
jgi:cytidylate kinase